ncbi:hypothetical protein ACFVZJ_41645, partial [Streptomyces sp. NPDC058322]|uniref:hypothetical protein n=1 Tax=Streptomyces sp. NPDC058322 TaxID=3346446 RepID=UPI0036F085F3
PVYNDYTGLVFLLGFVCLVFFNTRRGWVAGRATPTRLLSVPIARHRSNDAIDLPTSTEAL